MTTTVRPVSGLALVDPSDLHPSPTNPREHLTDIMELALSIREVGMVQPIVAQRLDDGRLQIVAGHRRHAAALRLKLTEVPVIIRRPMRGDDELLAMLVENGQRAGLDPIEEARAFRKLKSTGSGITDAAIARRVGRAQTYVSARLALLALPVEEQEKVRAKVMTLGAAVGAARLESGRVRPGAKGRPGPQHLGVGHDLATRAGARCRSLGHKVGKGTSVGGVACGKCWEHVIRADERDQLHAKSNDRGQCVLCDHPHDA